VANEIRIVAKKIDLSEIEKVGEAGKRAGKEAGAGLERGLKEGEQGAKRALDGVDDKLDQTATAGRRAGDKAGQGLAEGVGDGARKAGKKVDDGLGDAVDAAGAKGGEGGSAFSEKFAGAVETTQGGPAGIVEGALGQVAEIGAPFAVGAVVGGLLVKGFAESVQRQDLGAALSAKLGGTVHDAQHLGRLAGSVYADNYGDSIQDAADGIRAVVQNRLVDIASSTDEQIRNMSELALTTAKVVDEDANAVARAARQMLVNGLANSAEEAFDIIVRASQKGLNVNDDLIDTIVEYGTKFRDLGLTGQDAMGLISQALDAGARDTDTAADALKEFAIRAEEGSAATARGFQSVGLNARTMSDDIAAGGDRARSALGKTLDGLRAIHDPVLRDQAAVDLFGTKAEDLGDALYALDLDSVATEFDKVADATKNASAAMETDAARAEKAWRQFGQGITNNLDNVGAFLYDLGGDMAMILGLQQRIAGNPVPAPDAQPMIDYRQRVDDAAHAWENQGGAIRHTIDTLDEFISKQEKLAGGVLNLSEAQIRFQKAIDDGAESLKANGKTLDIHTEKGRENREALNDLAKAAYDQIAAMEEQGATAGDLGIFMASARDQFVQMAIGMGMNREEARRLADQLHLIPGDYVARVKAETGQAANEIRSIHGQLIDLTRRSYVASVQVTQKSMGGKMFVGYEHGGVMGHAAEGGPRGGRVMVNEAGPEIIDLPTGSTVHSHGDSMRMLGAMGSGVGELRVVLDIAPGADSATAAMLRSLLANDILKLRVDAAGRVRSG
jgi:hypothetical protein